MNFFKIMKKFLRILLRKWGWAKVDAAIRYHLILKRQFGNIRFQGQHLQDMIAYLFFKTKENGFYIDIGANDGISGSNTYIFEKLGWNGICIEPQPDVYKILKIYRKCDSYNAALSSESINDAEFFTIQGADALGGLNKSTTQSHKNWAKQHGIIKYITVRTMTFDEIMKNYPNVSYIDFMSIDVEGHEMTILNTINFDKYHFGLITIEKGNDDIITFMKQNGYSVFMELGSDILYTPKDA